MNDSIVIERETMQAIANAIRQRTAQYVSPISTVSFYSDVPIQNINFDSVYEQAEYNYQHSIWDKEKLKALVGAGELGIGEYETITGFEFSVFG